jgi:hypothetical protein
LLFWVHQRTGHAEGFPNAVAGLAEVTWWNFFHHVRPRPLPLAGLFVVEGTGHYCLYPIARSIPMREHDAMTGASHSAKQPACETRRVLEKAVVSAVQAVYAAKESERAPLRQAEREAVRNLNAHIKDHGCTG